MMMSLFSPVEALCAESIGQKLGFSFATAAKADENRAAVLIAPESDDKKAAATASVPSVDQGMNKGVASRSSSSSSSSSSSPPPPSNSKKTTSTMIQRRPRFAPELDGVFCFETIIPY